MGRDDRQKLSDVVNNTDYLFKKKVNSFEEAYPSIASLQVEVTETSLGLYRKNLPPCIELQ